MYPLPSAPKKSYSDQALAATQTAHHWEMPRAHSLDSSLGSVRCVGINQIRPVTCDFTRFHNVEYYLIFWILGCFSRLAGSRRGLQLSAIGVGRSGVLSGCDEQIRVRWLSGRCCKGGKKASS